MTKLNLILSGNSSSVVERIGPNTKGYFGLWMQFPQSQTRSVIKVDLNIAYFCSFRIEK